MSTEEQIEALAHQSRTYRTLTAVYQTGSVEVNVASRNIYEFYNKDLPLKMVEEIVKEYLPLLRREGLMEGDKLTEAGKRIAIQHEKLIR